MATVALTGCQSDNSANETDSGYRYEIFTDVEGETGNPGDYVYLDIKMIADETEMFDTRDNPNPPEPMRLPPEGEVVAGHMRPIEVLEHQQSV